MSLQPVTYHFRQEHAAKMRKAADKLGKSGVTECIEVALYLHNLADKIDNAFEVPAKNNVVPFAR